MKKILIASTALVAMGLIGMDTASASEKIKLNVGGFARWWVVGAWQSDKWEERHPGQDAGTNADVKGDVEIHFTGETQLDNGLKIGAVVELEGGGQTQQPGTSNDIIDESYVWVQGNFGKIILGSENNGAYLLHVTAPDAAGNWNEGGMITGNRSIARPGGLIIKSMLGGNTTAILTDNDADKITYVAPSFGGLTVGATFVPNAKAVGINNTLGANGGLIGEDNANFNQGGVPAYGVGALFARNFGPVGVKVSGGWVTYDAGIFNGGVGGTGDGTALLGAQSGGDGNSQEWSAGSQLSYAGFTLGGSYRAQMISGTSLLDGRAWDLGLQYANGPYAVSVSTFQSKVGTDATTRGGTGGGKDTTAVYQMSGKYSMGPGVDVLGSLGYIGYDDKGAGDDDNHGYVAMTGLSLTF